MLGGEGVPGLPAGDVWVFGHTHWGYEFTQGEEACISNVMGALKNLANVEKTGWGKYPDFEMRSRTERNVLSRPPPEAGVAG